MTIFKNNGLFYYSSPFSGKVTELEHQPKKKTVVIELTYDNGRVAQYRQPDDIGPHPNIFEGFIEVGEGEFVSAKGVAKIETWRETEE